MSRAWSLGKTDRFKMDAETKKNISLQNVAPGTYERHLKDKKDEPKWSMGAKVQDIDKRVVVSPQSYNIPSKIIEKQGKSIGAKLKGSMETNSIAPGPGAYTQEKVIYNNLQYSMGGKLDPSKSLNVPGPGTYEATLVNKDAVKCGKFGTGNRGKVELPNKNVPGPGEHSPDYKTLKNQSPRFGFGSEKRASPINEKLAQLPGPGNYALQGVIGKDGTSKTMHSVIKYSPLEKEQSYKPGAGTYDPNIFNSKKKEPQYKLGTGKRDDLQFEKMKTFQQSPGAYNPSHAQTWTSASKWGFGSDTRKHVVNRDAPNFPGAGSYSIPSRLQENSKYSMGARLNTDNSPMKNIPGPGQYDLQNKDNANMKNSKKFSVGTSQRGGLVTKSLTAVPGPGNYKDTLYNKSTSPKFGFGSGGRAQMNKTMSMIPGPGAYQNRSIIGTEGNLNSIHAKLEYKPIENIGGKTPGPGAYEAHAKNKRKAPAYGSGSEKRDFGVAKYILGMPAPSAYNPNASVTQRSGAKWGFGSETRKGPIEAEKRKNSPGPGNYNIEPLAFDTKKPKFFVGEKLKPPKEVTNTPGVGSYDPSPERTKKTLPSYSMKQKLGSVLVDDKNKNPGAGTYELNLNNKHAAPKFGFGSSKRNEKDRKAYVPGPGTYKIPSSIGDVPAFAMPNRPQEFKYV